MPDGTHYAVSGSLLVPGILVVGVVFWLIKCAIGYVRRKK